MTTPAAGNVTNHPLKASASCTTPWTDGSGVRDYVAANSTTTPAPPTAGPHAGIQRLENKAYRP